MIAFINRKIGKMQTIIAITAGTLVLSLFIIAGQNEWFELIEVAVDTMAMLNF